MRKSAATRFADGGATVTELMSWFGWRTPAEAIRYVEAADRRRAAKAAAHGVDRGLERRRVGPEGEGEIGLLAMKRELTVLDALRPTRTTSHFE